MSIVVTGAAGFIGRHVTAALVDRGHDVVGIDRRSCGPDDVAVLCGDLADPSPEIVDALLGAEGVIHLAGRPGVRDDAADADRLRHRDNVVAGARVLEIAPGHVPVVVASSSSVYGGSRADRPSREDDRLRPRGGYARSKAALEALCAARRSRGGHVGVVRPFTVAGEGQRPDMAVARWIDAIAQGRPLTILGHPDRRRDVTDVRDVVEGVIRMLEREVDETVNLGTGTSHRLADLVAALTEVAGVDVAIDVRAAHPDEALHTRADVRRCRRLLGFAPSTDLPGLLARQLACQSSQRTPFTAVA